MRNNNNNLIYLDETILNNKIENMTVYVSASSKYEKHHFDGQS